MRNFVLVLACLLIFNPIGWAQIPNGGLGGLMPDSSVQGLIYRLFKTQNVNEAVEALKPLEHIKKFHTLLYLGASYNAVPEKKEADFVFQSARVDITGNIIPKRLSFRLRVRVYPTVTDADRLGYNKINHSLDYAYFHYYITKKISLIAGKTLRLYGGFEWDANPITIYQYNNFLLNRDPFFPLGAILGYDFNKNHKLMLSFYQPNNKTFANIERFIGLKAAPNQIASKIPIGIALYWKGNFLNDKIQTIWSAFAEQNIKNETNYTAILGQKFNLHKKFDFFIDYTFSYIPTDYTALTSPLLNKYIYKNGFFAKNIIYQVLSSRIHYKFTDNFRFVLSDFFEFAGQPSDYRVGNNFHHHFLYIFTLEYYPIKTEPLVFYIFSQQEHNIYNQNLKASGVNNQFIHKIGVGFWYILPIF